MLSNLWKTQPMSATIKPLVWTTEEFVAKECSLSDIGQTKPEHLQPPPPAPPPPGTPAFPEDEATPEESLSLAGLTDTEISALSIRVLRSAAIKVFDKLGKEKWLYDLARSDPNAYLKILQRLLPQMVDASVSITANQIPKTIRDLSLDDLRAMRSHLPQYDRYMPDTINANAASSSNIIEAEFEEVPR